MNFTHIQTVIRFYEKMSKAMFTLYRIVKWYIAESISDRASVHSRNTAFKAFSALEQYCSTWLLKVDCSVSDKVLKWSQSCLNTFIRADIATAPCFGKGSFEIKRECCKLYDR